MRVVAAPSANSYGVIVKLDTKRGFGFIAPHAKAPRASHAFFHFSDVAEPEWLAEGEKVSFTKLTDQHGRKVAKTVQVVGEPEPVLDVRPKAFVAYARGKGHYEGCNTELTGLFGTELDVIKKVAKSWAYEWGNGYEGNAEYDPAQIVLHNEDENVKITLVEVRPELAKPEEEATIAAVDGEDIPVKALERMLNEELLDRFMRSNDQLKADANKARALAICRNHKLPQALATRLESLQPSESIRIGL